MCMNSIFSESAIWPWTWNWCGTLRLARLMSNAFLGNYLLVKVYDYVELEIKLKLLDFFLLDSTLS